MSNQEIVKYIERMYSNCSNVQDEDDIHKDAKDLARVVKIELNKLIVKINEQQTQ